MASTNETRRRRMRKAYYRCVDAWDRLYAARRELERAAERLSPGERRAMEAELSLPEASLDKPDVVSGECGC